MKKIIYIGICVLVGIFALNQLLFYIAPPKTLPEQIGDEVVDKMGKHYKISGYGWVGQNFRSRVKFSIDGLEDFDPNKHLQVFSESLHSLLNSLNANLTLIEENGEEFNHSNTGLTIFWLDPNSQDGLNRWAVVKTVWDDDIMVVYFLPGGLEVTKNVPYETFKKLVEEKRFDEILHYGE